MCRANWTLFCLTYRWQFWKLRMAFHPVGQLGKPLPGIIYAKARNKLKPEKNFLVTRL